MGSPRQEYWSGLPFPSPGDLPDPGIKPTSPALVGGLFSTERPGKPLLFIVDIAIQICYVRINRNESVEIENLICAGEKEGEEGRDCIISYKTNFSKEGNLIISLLGELPDGYATDSSKQHRTSTSRSQLCTNSTFCGWALVMVSNLKASPWNPRIHYYESIHSTCRQVRSPDAMASVLAATHV